MFCNIRVQKEIQKFQQEIQQKKGNQFVEQFSDTGGHRLEPHLFQDEISKHLRKISKKISKKSKKRKSVCGIVFKTFQKYVQKNSSRNPTNKKRNQFVEQFSDAAARAPSDAASGEGQQLCRKNTFSIFAKEVENIFFVYW